ncbi:hypothetical protein OG21DRAFT_1498426, partial [Imleria badia]
MSRQSIGYLAQFITTLEENPRVPQLFRNGTPFLSTMCLAEHSPSFPDQLRTLARKAISDDVASERLKRALPNAHRSSSTSSALAQGTSSSITELQQHLARVLQPVARKYDLTLTAFRRVVHTGQVGQVSMSEECDSAPHPSPVTPTGNGPYSILAGTIKATMESSKFHNATQVVVAPSLLL